MKDTRTINREIMVIMERLKKHLSRDQHFLKAYEDVSMRKLQKICLGKGISLKGYLSLCDALREIKEREREEGELPEYDLKDILSVHEAIRIEKGLTKTNIRLSMRMDMGNFCRFFRSPRQKTTSMRKIEELCNSIDMTIPDFLGRVNIYLREKREKSGEEAL